MCRANRHFSLEIRFRVLPTNEAVGMAYFLTVERPEDVFCLVVCGR